MRTEKEVVTALATARAGYHAAANVESAPELYERTQAIRALNEELQEVLRGDAVACPTCGDFPHAHIKTPEHENRGQIMPAVYEVGCLNCKAVAVPSAERADRVVVTYAAARANSAAAAVAAWNRGERFTKILPTSA